MFTGVKNHNGPAQNAASQNNTSSIQWQLIDGLLSKQMYDEAFQMLLR